jgi:hypothetical protein
LLEGHQSVTGASVNLATETALVKVSMGVAAPDMMDSMILNLGQELAQVCIFSASSFFSCSLMTCLLLVSSDACHFAVGVSSRRHVEFDRASAHAGSRSTGLVGCLSRVPAFPQ